MSRVGKRKTSLVVQDMYFCSYIVQNLSPNVSEKKKKIFQISKKKWHEWGQKVCQV